MGFNLKLFTLVLLCGIGMGLANLAGATSYQGIVIALLFSIWLKTTKTNELLCTREKKE